MCKACVYAGHIQHCEHKRGQDVITYHRW